jgi:hypothetical protein
MTVVLIIITAGILLTMGTIAMTQHRIDASDSVAGKTLETLKSEYDEICSERDSLLIERQVTCNGDSSKYSKQDRLNELDALYLEYRKAIRKQDMRSILEQGELQLWKEELDFQLNYAEAPEFDPTGRGRLEKKIAIVLLSKLENDLNDKSTSDIDLYREFEIMKSAYYASDQVYTENPENPQDESEKLLTRISDANYTVFDFAKEFGIVVDAL